MVNWKNQFWSIIFYLLIVGYSTCIANAGRIRGKIKDVNELGISDVIVQLQNTNKSTLSDSLGNFNINEIAYGSYYIIFIKKGYYSLIIPDVLIKNSNSVELNIDLVKGNENEYLFLEIGGIQVTADRELLPEEPEMIYKISSGEIEHMQANSLANVLSLIPGNVQNKTPGLQSKQNILLRTFDNQAEDQAELFGTKIIVDDIPLSNNANLQTGVGVGYGAAVQNTNNSQIDLREIVAENIEYVEVSFGASSVEYGDLTQGIINVKTKTSNIPTRFKIKNNPDTREANLMGSFYLNQTDFTYNLNYGFSERDIRITGDEYHRISGELKVKNDHFSPDMELINLFKYGRIIEEDNDESDPDKTRAYNRDYYWIYSHKINYQINESTSIYIRNFINFKRRNSWRRQQESEDGAIWTDRLAPGTREGIIPSSSVYFSEVRTIGEEWSIGAKLRMNRNILLGKTLHRFLIGLEYQNDKNSGPGKTYDMLKPPYGRTSERPRSFDDIPGMVQISLFAEDRISGDFILPYTINIGFRLDSYNPSGFTISNIFKNKDVFSASQGTFFNPRIGVKLKVSDQSQIRLSFNKASKVPALSSIYPPLYFIDVYDVGVVTINDTLKNIDLVSTYAFNGMSDKLKGYQTAKYEISYDQKCGNVGFSLNAYFQNTLGAPRYEDIPYSFARYVWGEWPGNSNKHPIEKFTTHDSRYTIARNLGKSEISGIELDFVTHRIPKLNMRFKMNASYNFKKYSSEFYKDYSSTINFVYGDTLPNGQVANTETQVLPYYAPVKKWQQRTVINYHLDYISKPLGIWLTIKAQQILWNQMLLRSNNDPYAKGYYMNGNVFQVDAQTSTKYGLDRQFNENIVTTDKRRPNDQWMFCFVLSKSLFKGSEFSIFVENIFNDRAYYTDVNNLLSPRNHEIFWGISFSSKLDELF